MRKVFWLFVFLSLASVAWHYSLQNHSNFMREIEKYRSENNDSVDLSPVLQSHLKADMKKDEVLGFFEDAGFEIRPRKSQELEKADESNEIYVAHFSAPMLIPIIPVYKVYKFTLFFKDGSLVRYEGFAYSESP